MPLFSSNHQVMGATKLSAIVTLILTLIKTAKYPAKRQKRFASTHPHFSARIAQKGRPGQGATVSDFTKKHSSLTFFFKSIGDGCNGYSCDCINVDSVTKIGIIHNCESTEEGCHPDEADNGTAGEFPLLQILFCVSFFPSDGTRGEVRGRQRMERRKR